MSESVTGWKFTVVSLSQDGKLQDGVCCRMVSYRGESITGWKVTGVSL